MSAAWWSGAVEAMARMEYEARPTTGGVQAPNRAHGLRTYFRDAGIEVLPRETRGETPEWRFTWRMVSWGRAGRMTTVVPGDASPRASGTRVLYERRGFDEWYENSREGLEQGFTIHERPPGDGALGLTGRIGGGLTAQAGRDAVDFLDTNESRVFRYGKLLVLDAAGRDVPSRLVLDGDELTIVVADQEATYPLIVDPLMTTPDWTADGEQEGERFGDSVATAGDVNGDGYSDVIVGAPEYDNGTRRGRAFLFPGSPSGLSLSPAWTATGASSYADFATSVASAGDIDGDGYSDVIIGAPGSHKVYVYRGSAAGLSETPDWTSATGQAHSHLGNAVACAGDVNGDGFSDIIFGAHMHDDTLQNDGAAFVYHGSPAGLDSIPDWTAAGTQLAERFGFSVASAGDVNGDGFSDVVIGSEDYDAVGGTGGEGRASVFYGSASGLAQSPAWTAEGETGLALFGHSVSTAGDVNGDGYSDVVVGAPRHDDATTEFAGRAFLYYGSIGGLSSSDNWTANLAVDYAWFGRSVATAGDVNGDGYADVVIGAGAAGYAAAYLGSATGLATSATWEIGGGSSTRYSVATAGDVNGDGYSDVIVSAPLYDDGQPDEGRVFVYHGSGNGLSLTPAWTAEGDADGAWFGGSVGSAGDVNNDGFADVIVGAPLFDAGAGDLGLAYVFHGSPAGLETDPAWVAGVEGEGGQFGGSVAGAGDVNGDGFADVIVGASSYDGVGQPNEGKVFVYLGSPTGLSETADWSAEGNEVGALFGSAVAGAGDVNRDGFSDVVIGASSAGNGGAAFVYHGSADGLLDTPAWSEETAPSGAKFGHAVSTAGDVNGDGYADVIVGAPSLEDEQPKEGAAFLYLGSSAGLSAGAAWSVTSDTAEAQLGLSVAAAGDVNHDGYSDIIVGVPLPVSAPGLALVYHGSASGVPSFPDWTASGDQDFSWFGSSVAGAGDVNGDGISDVVVGNWRYDNGDTQGRVYAYLGNDAGGLERRPRQFQPDESAPIALLGASDDVPRFVAKMIGRSPGGRVNVGLEVEVKPIGAPFTGVGLITGPAEDTGTEGVELSQLVTGLFLDTPYRWRVRTVTSSPLFPRSPWFSIPGNATTETDLRTAAPVVAVDSADPAVGGGHRLAPPSPNPFRTGTEVAFTLDRAGDVRLAVYDVTGRRVAHLAEGRYEQGRHALRWDGSGAGASKVAAGIYFLRLDLASGTETRKLVLVD